MPFIERITSHSYRCTNNQRLAASLLLRAWEPTPHGITELFRLTQGGAIISLSPVGAVRVTGSNTHVATAALDALAAESGVR
jgi:hypothetical protein